jgi:2,3-bisphosphoglycerate-dependent phosphoglycerate mutase
MNERTANRALWLVRHGESTWNAAGLVQGQATGPVLTAKGRTEAARVAGCLGDLRVGAIYTSDLARARETASIVARVLELPLQVDPALRERSFGVAEGHPLGDLDPAQSGIELDRVVDADARPRGGESVRDLYGRVRDFITALEVGATDDDVLVVTHGGVIRVAGAYCNGISVEDMAWGPVPNASIRGLSRPPSTVAGMR